MDAEENDLERALILLCARTAVDTHSRSKIQALLKLPINWERLVSLAREHLVTQLLFWHLKEFAELVPPSIMEQLYIEFHSNLRRNLYLTNELHRVLTLFEAQGIQTLPFKGSTLAQDAYGNVALRVFSDIDVLIKKEDFQRVKQVLKSAGYVPLRPSGAEEKLQLLSLCEAEFVNSWGTAGVDVHWSISDIQSLSQLNLPQLVRDARSTIVNGKIFPCLAPEDALLFCCIHGFKHLFYYLQNVSDVAEIIRANPQFNWAVLAENAARLHADEMLFLGLRLARDLLDASVSNSVLQNIEGETPISDMVREIETQMFAQTRHPPTELDLIVAALHIQKSVRDRVHSVLGVIFVPNLADYELLPLPVAAFKLYYLLRPARILLESGSQLVKRAPKRESL